MKFSPTIGSSLLWFWLKTILFFIMSGIYGFAFLKLIKYFVKAWKENNQLKLWLCLSAAFFGIIILLEGFFRGIKQ